MIKIAIADDEALFRKGMMALLSDYADFQIILEAENGKVLLTNLAAAAESPDVLLLDLNMPEMNGIETARVLQREYADLKIVVLSSYFSKAFIINMMELGAAAYLPKNAEPQMVELTIREVAEKGFFYTDEVMTVIRENMVQKKRGTPKAGFVVELTKREKEILQLICEQATTPEIAAKLFISTRTVEGHRNNLLQKLGCRNTAGLVVCALEYNLVNINPDTFWFGK
ncbi:MAG: response regulator [Saprospiraceae bacterium]